MSSFEPVAEDVVGIGEYGAAAEDDAAFGVAVGTLDDDVWSAGRGVSEAQAQAVAAGRERYG